MILIMATVAPNVDPQRGGNFEGGSSEACNDGGYYSGKLKPRWSRPFKLNLQQQLLGQWWRIKDAGEVER